MITRDQLHAMVLIRKREGNFLSALPKDWFNYMINMDDGPKSEINIALRHAASGLKEDMAKLLEMLKANPRLLLQAGNVVVVGKQVAFWNTFRTKTSGTRFRNTS